MITFFLPPFTEQIIVQKEFENVKKIMQKKNVKKIMQFKEQISQELLKRFPSILICKIVYM